MLPLIALFMSLPLIEFRVAEDLGSLDWSHGEVPPLVILQIMEGLTHIGPRGEAMPAIARKWTFARNGKSVIFMLRKNARWSDGKPVCAGDFVYAWQRALDPRKPTPYAHILHDLDRATAEGCNTLHVRFKRPARHFASLAAHWVLHPVRADLIHAHGDGAFQLPHLVTTGPYELSEWNPGQFFTMKPNAHYHGPLPRHGLKAHVITDDNTALTLFRSGKIHWMKDLPFGERSAAKIMTGFRAHPALIGYFLGFDMNHGPFNDRNARCAVAHALDLRQIPALLGGDEEPATGWSPKILRPGAPRGSVLFNPAQARELLAGSKSREPFSIHYYSKDIHQPLMEWVQAQLKANLGLAVSLQRQEGKSYWARLRENPYPIFLSGTTAWYAHPFAFFSELVSTSTANWGHYQSAAYDAAAASNAFEKAERQLLREDCAIVPLYFRSTLTLSSPLLSGVEVSPLGQAEFSRARLKAPSPR